MSTITPEEKPKPAAKIINVISSNNQFKVNKEFKLQATDGSDFTFSNLEDKYTIIYFGFSYCPDICPITLQRMSEASKLLSKEELEKTQFIFVSVDPSRDTLETLGKFITEFDNIKGITGTKQEIDKLSSSLSVYYAKMEPSSENKNDYYVDHSSFAYLLNPNVDLISQFTIKASPEEIAQQLKNEIEK